MANYDGSIRIKTEIEVKTAEKNLASLESRMEKTANKISSLKKDIDALEQEKVPTEAYKDMQKELETAYANLNALVEKQKELKDMGFEIIPASLEKELDQAGQKVGEIEEKIEQLVKEGKAFTLGSDTEKYQRLSQQLSEQENAYEVMNQQRDIAVEKLDIATQKLEAEKVEEERLAKIRSNAVVNNQHIVDVMERRKQLLAEIKDLEAVGVTAGYQQYDSAQQELSAINSEIKDYGNSINQAKDSYKKLGNNAKQSLEKVNKSVKKSNGFLGTMASRFKGLALSLLIFNQISKAFRAISQGMKEGFQNLYSENDKFANSVNSLKASVLTLKNSFAAAFRPLVEIAIPYIQKAVEYITQLVNAIGQFIAVATGQKTYTKAVKQTADAFKDAEKAADGYLSPLDEINKYQSEDTQEESASGLMFEEVSTDNKFPSFLQEIAEYVQKLKSIFGQGLMDGLGDWEYRWESIKDSVLFIKNNLIDIWTDSQVLSSADSWAQSIVYMLGSLAGSMASIGLTIATNLLGGIEKYLKENKDRIKNYLVSMFDIGKDINYLFSDLFNSISYVFEAFASENGQQLTANIIGIFSDAFMYVMELASKLFRDISKIIIQPFTDNKEAFRTALEDFLGILSKVTGTIKQGIDDTFDKLNEVYDEHLKPLFDELAQGISDLTGKFLEFWNGKVKPILDEWADKFDTLWKQHLQPAINSIADAVGSLGDLLKTLWKQIVKPLLNWLIDEIFPALLPLFNALYDTAVFVIGGIADFIKMIADVVKDVVDLVTSIINGDWKSAWEAAKNIVLDIWDGITSIIGGAVDLIKGWIDDIIGWFTGENDGAKSLAPVKNSGTNFSRSSFASLYSSPAIDSLSKVDIPGYATGQVIPTSMKRHLAILGDNSRETEVVSPLSTIEEAVENVMARIGGNSNNQTIIVKLIADGKELTDLVIKNGAVRQMSSGNNPFMLGTT